jgi:hypothetical protein
MRAAEIIGCPVIIFSFYRVFFCVHTHPANRILGGHRLPMTKRNYQPPGVNLIRLPTAPMASPIKITAKNMNTVNFIPFPPRCLSTNAVGINSWIRPLKKILYLRPVISR